MTDERKGATLVRTLIDLYVMAVTAGTGGTCGLGISMVNLDGHAASALPEADSASDQPGWIWRTVVPVFTDTVNAFANATHIKEDIKSRRKYAGDDMLIDLIIDNVTGSTSFNVDGMIRLLIMKS